MEVNNKRTSFPEGMEDGSKENENDTSVTASYRIGQPKLIQQKSVTGDYDGSIVRNNKASDMEKVPRNYTKSFDNMSSNTKSIINKSINSNSLYDVGMPVAVYPSVLSNSEWFNTPYARGLHIDLLHGGTAKLDAESSVQSLGGIGLTDDETALGDAQRGIPAKHIPGETDLTRGGIGNHGSLIPGSSELQQHQKNPQEPERLFGSITDKLVGVGMGLEGYQSKDNADGKLWSGYDSHKYDHHDVDFGYGSVPLLYQPWYHSYGQYYITPYHRVHTDHGYDLRQFGVDGSGFVTVGKNLGLDGKLGIGLL